uniref:Protein kinase domain-containing protein n=1 Tax=Chrysemys picta bellii TaxID=8478 RepID=A0A8C3FRT4_CHRPI
RAVPPPPRSQCKLKKLSEDSLTKQPEEVFDVLEKLGEGSYGSVFKAIHKESGQVVAIKQVPVESDLQEIIKEISIMQQCDRCIFKKEKILNLNKKSDLFLFVF